MVELKKCYFCEEKIKNRREDSKYCKECKRKLDNLRAEWKIKYDRKIRADAKLAGKIEEAEIDKRIATRVNLNQKKIEEERERKEEYRRFDEKFKKDQENIRKENAEFMKKYLNQEGL